MTNYINFSNEPFKTLRDCADSLGLNAYVVGGYVRDLLLGIPSHDIDIVVEGSGIELAKEFQRRFPDQKLSIYESYGTAAVGEVEFVGARKESYQRGSRNPIVEQGTLLDDLTRRDFTINAMAISLQTGELIDVFNGLEDLKNRIINTPVEPIVTFTDDPLRMLRAIRFATKLGFYIEDRVFQRIKEAAPDIKIIVKERIWTELEKIMSYDLADGGWYLLHETGLLKEIIPELEELAEMDDYKHKNNLFHSLKVLKNVIGYGASIPLRWAALFHDVGKGPAKRQIDGKWTFHGHDIAGAEMIPDIMSRLKAPNDLSEYMVLLTKLHMRPQIIANAEVTDSAIRRLANEVGPYLQDLMILSESDITTKNLEKKQKFLESYQDVRNRMAELAQRDYIREFKPVINGFEIMEIFGLESGEAVGKIKSKMKEDILDGKVENSREELLKYLYRLKNGE